MRYLIIAVGLAFLSACGGSEPQASNTEVVKTEAATKSDDVLFQDHRSALQKAKGVEGMVLDAGQQQRAQIDALD